MATIGSIIRISGSAVVSTYARNHAEHVEPPDAIVRMMAHGSARLNGELSVSAQALVSVVASAADPQLHVGAIGEAIVTDYVRANARVNGEIRVQPKPAVVGLRARGIVAETWQFFEPLTSTGSEGSYAQSGTYLQPLATEGEGGQVGDDVYAEGTANFYALHTSGVSFSGGLGQHDADLQPLLSIGSEGGYAQAEGSLSPLQSLAFEELQHPNLARLEQPTSTLQASGTQFYGETHLEQPAGAVSGRFGAVARFTQPQATITLDGDFPIVGRTRLTQPHSTLDASALSGSVGRARLTQPRGTLAGGDGWSLSLVSPGHGLVVEATFGAVGRAELSQPRTVLTAVGGEANWGAARLVQPVGYMPITGLVLLEQPAAQLAATGGEQVEQYVYAAYAVNLAHMGVSTYSDYPFRRIVEFNGEYYGVGPQGIFRLDANTDAGTAVRSVIETGRPDFGTSQDKRVTYAYALLDTRDTLDVTPVTGEREGYTQQAMGSGRTGKHNRRVQFGRGMKARNWGLRLEHVGDDRFALDEIEFVGEVLRRKVGG